MSIDTVNRIHYKSILSDDKQGSGRSRVRGMEMYKFHEELGEFDDMYQDAVNAKSPVIVITSVVSTVVVVTVVVTGTAALSEIIL